MFFSKWRQKQAILKSFGRYAPKETIERLLNGIPEVSRFEEREIFFLLLSFEQDDSLLVKIPKAIELLHHFNCVIEEINQVFLKCSIGSLPVPKNLDIDSEMRKIVASLESVDFWCTVVYGKRKARVGNLGTQNRMSYGSIVPDLRGSLKKLLEMEKGKIEEV